MFARRVLRDMERALNSRMNAMLALWAILDTLLLCACDVVKRFLIVVFGHKLDFVVFCAVTGSLLHLPECIVLKIYDVGVCLHMSLFPQLYHLRFARSSDFTGQDRA